MPGASSIVVRIVGDSKGLEAAFARSSAATKGFAGNMQKAGAMTSKVGRGLTMGITVPAVAVGVAAFKMSKDFEKSMTNMEALVKGNRGNMDVLRKGVMDVSKETGKSAKEMADAMYFITSSGIPAAKATDVLRYAAKAAAAGMGDTATVADATTSALNAYGTANLSAKEATDILVAAIDQGKAEPEEFAAAIGKVIAPAQAVGVSFDEVAASMAAMSLQGVPAATSASALRQMFVNFQKPSKQMKKTIDEAGWSMEGLNKSIATKGLLPTLMSLKQRFGDNKEALAKMFPSLEAFSAFQQLTGTQAQKNVGIFKALGDATGTTAEAFAVASEKAGFRWDKAMNMMKLSLIQLGGFLAPILASIAEKLAAFVEKAKAWFDGLSPEGQKLVKIFVGVAIAIGPLLMIIGSIVGALAPLAPVIMAIASPVGLVAAAVVVLVGAMVAAKLAPEQFAAVLMKLGLSADQAKGLVTGLATAFDILAPVVQAVASLLGNSIVTILKIVGDMVRLISALLKGDWSEAWDAAQDIVKTWASGIWKNFNTLLGLVPFVKRLFGNIVLGVLEPLSKLPLIGDKFKAAKDAVEKWMDPAKWKTKQMMKKVGGDAIDALEDALTAKKIDPKKISAASPALGIAVEKNMKDQESKVKTGAAKVVTALQSKNPEVRAAARSVAAQLLKMAEGIDGLSEIIGAKVAAEIQAGLQAGVTGAGKATKGSGPFEFTRHTVAPGLVKGATDLASQNMAGRTTQALTSETTKGVAGAKGTVEAAGKEVGKKLSDATLMGYLEGTASLPEKMSEKTRNAIEKAKSAVDAGKQKFTDAWSRMAGDALRAFDAATQAGLARMQANLQTKLDALDRQLTTALDKIEKKRAKKTPSELALEQMDKGIAAEDRAAALAAAKTGLSEAEAGKGFEAKEGETPEEATAREEARNQAILTARRALLDAERAIARAALEEDAAAERKKADDAAKTASDGATKRIGGAKTTATKLSEDAQKEYTSKRDNDKRNLEDWLEAQRVLLERHPEQWNKIYNRIKRKFADEFGPDFKTAGRNLGRGFIEGLEETFKDMDSAAENFAKLIAKYLKSASPPKAGPLKDIDKWGDRLFIDQFAGNIDKKELEKQIRKVGKSVKKGFIGGVGAGGGYAGMGGGGKTYGIGGSRDDLMGGGGGRQSWFEGKVDTGGSGGGGGGGGDGGGGGGAAAGLEAAMSGAPGKFDSQLLEIANSAAAASGKAEEFAEAIGSGNIKTDARLLDLLHQAGIRVWGPIVTPRFRDILDTMKSEAKGGLGLSGREAAMKNPPLTYPATAMALGGIVGKPTRALVGERGPEAVIPLGKLSRIMERSVAAGVREGSREGGGGGGGAKPGGGAPTTNISISGSTLYGGDRRKMADELSVDIEAALRRKEKATGKQLFVT